MAPDPSSGHIGRPATSQSSGTVARHEHHREAHRRTRRRHFQAPKAKPSTQASRGGKGELTKGFGLAREGAGDSHRGGEQNRPRQDLICGG